MKNYYITLLILVTFGCSRVFALEIKIDHSESASYLHFLAAGFQQPFSSRSLQDVIKNKNVKSFSKNKNKDDYNLLKSYLQNGYNFDSPNSRPSGVYGEDALNLLSVTNPSLTELEKNLSAFLPYDGINAYYRLKKVFYPEFEKILWDSSTKNHEQEMLKIKTAMENSRFVENLEKAKKFYASEYPENLALKVALIPINIGNGSIRHTSATNLKDAQIVPYISQLGAVSNLGVIFHEFCHAFYEAQSYKKQKEIEDYYLGHKSFHALFTYRYFNEFIATVLGNGWYQEKLDASKISKSWYDVEYIDKMAKALLPEVTKYVELGKSMDQSFLEKTINVAEQLFPDAPFQVESNMIAIKILSNLNISTSAISESLRKKFRIQSINKSAPIQSEDWNELTKVGVATPLTITNSKEELSPEIKSLLNEKTIKDVNMIAVIPVKNRFIVWMNLRDKAKLDGAIEILRDKKIFDKTLWVKEF